MRSLLTTWFIPSFYGDIRLDADPNDRQRTSLVYDRLTPSELKAMMALGERAVSKSWGRKPWAEEGSFAKVDLGASGTIVLAASMYDVHDVLAKSLKPERSLVTAIRFADGKVEELSDPLRSPEREGTSYREPPPPQPAEAEPAKKEEKAAKAVTVASPTIGCPAPDFERAELRATRVLSAFLNPEQLEDFQRYQQFVTFGGETGHRYLLTSRHARDRLAKVGGRSMYDLDEQCAYCVHDWTIPAAEELLTLHLFLSLPGREGYVRTIPEA